MNTSVIYHVCGMPGSPLLSGLAAMKQPFHRFQIFHMSESPSHLLVTHFRHFHLVIYCPVRINYRMCFCLGAFERLLLSLPCARHHLTLICHRQFIFFIKPHRHLLPCRSLLASGISMHPIRHSTIFRITLSSPQSASLVSSVHHHIVRHLPSHRPPTGIPPIVANDSPCLTRSLFGQTSLPMSRRNALTDSAMPFSFGKLASGISIIYRQVVPLQGSHHTCAVTP